MDIKVTNENARVPVVLMHLSGNLDAASYEQFQTKADELIKGGARYLLIDLAAVPFVSSAGLRALHQTFKELRAVHAEPDVSEEQAKQGVSAGTYKSGHLKLVNVSKNARTVFQTSGFDMYIEILDDMKTAIASF